MFKLLVSTDQLNPSILLFAFSLPFVAAAEDKPLLYTASGSCPRCGAEYLEIPYDPKTGRCESWVWPTAGLEVLPAGEG